MSISARRAFPIGWSVALFLFALLVALVAVIAGEAAYLVASGPAAIKLVRSGQQNAGSIGVQLVTAVMEIAAAGVVALFLPRLSRSNFRGLGFRLPDKRAVELAIAGVLFCFAYTIAFNAAEALFGIRHGAQNGFEHFSLKGVVPSIVAFTVLALVAPICEEIFFRGFLFNAFRAWMPMAPAAILSAALFAGAHGDVHFAAPIFVLGLTNAYLYRATGSIGTPILVHGLNNGIGALLLIAGGK